MKFPTLICTVGLPYSGKETWAKKQGLPVIDLEVVKGQLSQTPSNSNQRSKKETEVLTYTKQLIQSLFVSGNPVVILLAENLSQKDRDFWLDEAWDTRYKEFKTTEQQALRAAQSKGVISKATIEQIKKKAKAYEPLA